MLVIDADPDNQPDPSGWHPGPVPRARLLAHRAHQPALDAVHIARVQTEDQIARADTKATALLGLVGAALAGALTLFPRHTGLPAVLLGAATVALAAAVVALLHILRARPGHEHGPGRWALFHDQHDALIDELTRPAHQELPHQAARLTELARLAATKYRAVNVAVTLLTTGVVLLTLAVLI